MELSFAGFCVGKKVGDSEEVSGATVAASDGATVDVATDGLIVLVVMEDTSSVLTTDGVNVLIEALEGVGVLLTF